MVTSDLQSWLERFPVPITRWWVACSGGLDSVVLLHAMKQLPCYVQAIHIHHGLQPIADLWEASLQQQCIAWDIPFTTVHLALGPLTRNVEAIAREARYAAFERLLGPEDCLLTAHHQADQAETVLLKILRGTGVHGLSGIAPWRPLGQGFIARPFLDTPRQSLLDYAQAHQLTWSEDPSNATDTFDRNYVRHQVFPRIHQRFPGSDAKWGRAAHWCYEAGLLLDEQAKEDIGPIGKMLPWAPIALKTTARQINILRYWISAQHVALPSQAQMQEFIRQLQIVKLGKTPSLSWAGADIRYYNYNIYWVVGVDCPVEWDGVQPALLANGNWSSASDTPQAYYLAYRAQLTGRSLGRVKKYFQKYHIPPWLRTSTPLLFCIKTHEWVGDVLAES